MNFRSSHASFDLLTQDLLRVLEYVEPHPAHMSVYSHRLFQLLLHACTEFESLSRDLLAAQGSTVPRDRMTVLDYRTLEPSLRLERSVIVCRFWRPRPLLLRPFRGWSTAVPPLRWYADHHAAKHNRQSAFHVASLQNTLLATSAVFGVLARIDPFGFSSSGYSALRRGRGSWASTHFELRGPD